MKFPYVEFLGQAEDRVFRPLIPLTFKVDDITYKTYCLVDSGSDYCILPIQLAGTFKLKLDPHTCYRMQGADGNDFNVYKSPVEVEQIIEQSGFRDINCKSVVYFSESCGTFLLGQSGFLNQLKVTMNGRSRNLELDLCT